MGEPIKTIYDKAVEIALLTVEQPEGIPADELEFAVFQRAACYVPLLEVGGTVPRMLAYVGQSGREYVHVCSVESRDGEDVLVYCEPGAVIDGEDAATGAEAMDEQTNAPNPAADAVGPDAETEPDVETDPEEEDEVDSGSADGDAENETENENKGEGEHENEDSEGEPTAEDQGEDAGLDDGDAVVEEDGEAVDADVIELTEIPLPPDDTFLGITVRRILPGIVGKDALITIGTDTSYDVSDAFLADHKGCVVFAEQA